MFLTIPDECAPILRSLLFAELKRLEEEGQTTGGYSDKVHDLYAKVTERIREHATRNT